MSTNICIRIRDMDIFKNIQNIKNHKSFGPDGIVGEALKLGGETIAPYLNNEKIPTDWKSAIIVPVHKGGSRSNFNNYRPISLKSVVCKQMEKLVANFIRKFWKSRNWLSESQHSFRREYSCDSQ